MTPLSLLTAAAAVAVAVPETEQIYSVYDFGARGDGKHNDTAAIQLTLDAAAAAGGGVAHLPHNGTYLTGGGLNALGHAYDGVTLRVDGAVTVPGPTAKPAWSTPEQCGTAEHVSGSGGIPRSLCSVLLVMNVDRFTLQGSGSFTGFLFDEHQGPQPAGGNSFHWVNVTNLLVEGVRIAHFDGSMWIHFSQNITVRNVTLFNRNTPEETGNIEVGGMGSHGVPPPLCAWKDGKYNPTDPCLAQGGNWQYELNLLRPTSNFTMRDSTVNGGDDNVCIKNDTDGVLVENVHFTDGHGASIGSIPDCYGCHGHVTNVVFRNCTFGGNAPMKIKTWANTTGEVSNILFEDCTLNNASQAVAIGASYGTNACPCKWATDYGGPEQRGECRNYGPTLKGDAYWPAGYVGLGGRCGPEGDASNTIAIRNITFRGLVGTVQTPGSIDCRRGNPCSINMENVQLTTARPWTCGNANITSTGSVVPAIPKCPFGPSAAPPPPPPSPQQHCTKAKNIGCYNDSSFLVLPHYQPQVHDKVTFESCASACSSFGPKALAGIDAGNHCYCGPTLAVGASAYSRPLSECQTSSCHADPSEKGCGGAHRMLVYSITCTKAMSLAGGWQK